MIPFVDLQAQGRVLQPELNAALQRVLTSCDFILGADVVAFENAFADYLGARHCIGVGNGTDALTIILLALGLPEKSDVLLPVNTFMATASAVIQAGHRPVFVDMDPHTGLMDLTQLEMKATEKTRAIIPVHLYGQPVAMDYVLDMARARGWAVIEDACQAHGARYRGQRAGTFGDAAAFSFYPGKNLGAYGDAGAVVTNNSALSEKIRALRHHGQHRKNSHGSVGFNSRLDTLQAAVLNVKLPYLEAWNENRFSHALKYEQCLEKVPVTFLKRAPDRTHVYHLLVVRVRERERVAQYLHQKGIQTGIHYPIPLHLQPALAFLGYRAGDFPHAEKVTQEILSLPMYPELTGDQIAFVSECLAEALSTREERAAPAL